jgi:pyrroline-5-carboxylate reductase
MNINGEKIGFIGAGNMANALIKGLIDSGECKAEQITASDTDSKKLGQMESKYGISTTPSNTEVFQNCGIVLLCVKPQVIRSVLEEIRDEINNKHLIISIAAGIPIRMIQDIVNNPVPIIRVMPNMPAQIQQGISALSKNEIASPAHLEMALKIFNASGKSVVVEENMLDAVTALSGSGPGYVFRIMECFVEAGENLGFDRETALALVIQTFIGATQLASKESEKTLTQLVQMIAVPGGTTAAGLTYMEDNGLAESIKGGVEAACKRSVELGKNY